MAPFLNILMTNLILSGSIPLRPIGGIGFKQSSITSINIFAIFKNVNSAASCSLPENKIYMNKIIDSWLVSLYNLFKIIYKHFI